MVGGTGVRSEFVQQVVACARPVGGRVPGPPTPPPDLGPGARWYPRSWRRVAGTDCFAARDGASWFLALAGNGTAWEQFAGEVVAPGSRPVKLVPQAAAGAGLRALFPETAPRPLPADSPSFGCGDRLGLATPGHLRALAGYQVAPVLAQQSIRELTLTGRTYGEVVDAATWSVFQEGWRDGFGADGDHLKTAAEVRDLLAAGATFITLDLSLCLGRTEQCPPMPAALRDDAGRCWGGADTTLTIETADIERFWQVYGPAFPFIEEAHRLCEAARGAGGFDLEISVDETPKTTRPVDHLLLARELQRRGIGVTSVAPRFPGEFQKGIDYIGDLETLAEAVAQHAAIAREFGHKLGIHSGSDKFAAFPLLGEAAGDRLHVKTAGTSWLEAVRVVAATDPPLFRAIWAAAAAGFPRARQYYHIRTHLAEVAEAAAIPDAELPALLDQDAPRQFLHITYGEILRAPAAAGGTLGDRLRENLAAHEERYAAGLEAHFRRHLESLGLPARCQVIGDR